MYAQMCAGRLGREQWREAKTMSDAMAGEAARRVGSLEARSAALEAALSPDPGFAAAAHGIREGFRLTPGLVRALVARVDVFSKRRVRVTMRFEDYFEKLARIERSLR